MMISHETKTEYNTKISEQNIEPQKEQILHISKYT